MLAADSGSVEVTGVCSDKDSVGVVGVGCVISVVVGSAGMSTFCSSGIGIVGSASGISNFGSSGVGNVTLILSYLHRVKNI